jgi:hypothetical protein
MARAFSVESERSTFALPKQTREQIKALIIDLDLDARDVVIRAVAELHQRKHRDRDRNVYAELDELKAAVAALSAA